MHPGRQDSLQQLLDEALAIRQRLQDTVAELSEVEVRGSAGNGAVVVLLHGSGAAARVHIDPSVADPGRVADLEALVLAAARDAQEGVQELAARRMGMGMGMA